MTAGDAGVSTAGLCSETDCWKVLTVGERSRTYFKRQLANRFVYSPLLRVLIFNFWFRLAFVGFILFLIFLALFLPRIWRTTPPGITPIIKISGLDMARAWSLKRSALRAMAGGDFSAAAYAWQAAVANNPANPGLLRGALGNVLRLDRPDPKQQRPALGQAFWLLRLTGTNAADLELVAQVCDKFQFYDRTLRLLGPMEDRLTSAEEAAYLKALFHCGQMARFAGRWTRLSEKRFNITPELQLYHAAYLAGWGAASEARDGRRRLETALEDPPQRILSNRLRLLVCAHSGDAAGYQESLQRLAQWQSDTLLEHVIYWQLLAALGRKDEARELARSFPRPPASSLETVRLGETYVVLDLRDEARQFLQQRLQQFGDSPEVWMLQANLLVEDGKWEELRELALQLRQHPAVPDTLVGYSHYLQGRAELGLERPAVAEISFQKAAQRPFEDRALGLSAASGLLKLGYPAVARDILRPLENGLAATPEYWQALFAAACELKQSDLMSTAAARAYALQPGNAAAANNYAATLLVNRERAEEAVRLTLLLSGRFPDSTAARLNHGLALLLNRRTAEAEALLKAIPPEKLSAREAASLQLGLFEVYFNKQQYDKARQTSKRIDVKYLFPNQTQWLEETLRRMSEQPAAQSHVPVP